MEWRMSIRMHYETLYLFSLNFKLEHTFLAISTVKIEKNMGFLGILQMGLHLSSYGQFWKKILCNYMPVLHYNMKKIVSELMSP